MLDELLIEYADKFGENFPIFQVKHLDEDEITKLVQAAIENNIPFEPEYQDDVYY